MFADAGSEPELHSLAARIGLKLAWFQHHKPWFPHYDLTEPRRARAIKLGAIEVSKRQMFEHVQRRRAMEAEQQGCNLLEETAEATTPALPTAT